MRLFLHGEGPCSYGKRTATYDGRGARFLQKIEVERTRTAQGMYGVHAAKVDRLFRTPQLRPVWATTPAAARLSARLGRDRVLPASTSGGEGGW